jgi:hypothetical protein
MGIASMCDFQRIHSNGLTLSIKPFTINTRPVARRDLDLAPILAAFAPFFAEKSRLPKGVESKTMRPPLTASISASISAGSVEFGVQIFLHRRLSRFYSARHWEARASGPFCPRTLSADFDHRRGRHRRRPLRLINERRRSCKCS